MVARGLLIEDQHGHEYLLSTESSTHNSPPHISLSRRVDGRWAVLDTKRSNTMRAGFIAALLDFFSGICRLLHRVDTEQERSTEMGAHDPRSSDQSGHAGVNIQTVGRP
jgi:hypothetical protein